MILTKSTCMLPFKWRSLGVSPWLLLAIGKVQAQAQLRMRILLLSLAAPGVGIANVRMNGFQMAPDNVLDLMNLANLIKLSQYPGYSSCQIWTSAPPQCSGDAELNQA